jgi:hypothetical protein
VDTFREIRRVPSLRSGFQQKLLQQPFHRGISFIERGVELRGIFAAGFGHIGASTA